MRINRGATRYAYVDRRNGSAVTIVDRGGATAPLGAGQDPRWAGVMELWYRPQAGGLLQLARLTDQGWVVASYVGRVSGNSLAAAISTTTAVHRTDPLRVIENGVTDLPGLAWPVYSDSGTILAALAPDQPRDRMQSVVCIEAAFGRRTVFEGAVSEGTQASDFRMAGTSLCFKEADGHVYGVVDLANRTQTPDMLARPAEGVAHACPVYVAGRGLYVLHIRDNGRNGGTICLGTWASMKAGQPMGWILGESAGGGYEHDARPDGEAEVYAAWLQPDGSPASRVVNLTAAMVSLGRPALPASHASPTSGPKALGYNFDFGRYGDHPGLAANCTVIERQMFASSEGNAFVYPPDTDARLCGAIASETGFVGVDAIGLAGLDWARVRGVWVHEPGDARQARQMVDDARRRMAQAGRQPRPVLVVLRADMATDPQFGRIGDALVPELYFAEPEAAWDEQVAVSRARVAAICAAFPTDPIYLYVQAYDRNGRASWKARPDMLEALQHAANLELARTQVFGLFWFAYARPGGVLAYPQLGAWHAAQAAATVAPPLPVDPPVDPVDPPDPPAEDTMTHDDIKRYIAALDNTLLFGAVKRFHDEVVLPRDRPLDGAIKSAAWTAGDLDFWTGDVFTGGANGFFVRAYVPEFIIAMDKGRTAAQASGDGFDAAKNAYLDAVNPQ